MSGGSNSNPKQKQHEQGTTIRRPNIARFVFEHFKILKILNPQFSPLTPGISKNGVQKRILRVEISPEPDSELLTPDPRWKNEEKPNSRS